MTKRAIDLTAFDQLMLADKLDLLHKDGVYVGKRTEDNRTVLLYQVNNFYVEVYYKDYRRDVDKLLVSDNVEMVQPYLGQIGVKDLDNQQE
jgi:hypothetical protein